MSGRAVNLGDGQMALPLGLVARGFETPVAEAGSNAEARAWLGRTGEWPQGRLALWGPRGSGKTSLLRHWAAREGAQVLEGAALRFPMPPGALAIDDAGAADAHSLLHVLNAAQEGGHVVLLADALAPARWTVGLADLSSRLRAVVAVAIGAPEDALLRALLGRQLAVRQLRVPEATLSWLLARLPRTHAAVIDAVARLDRAAQCAGQAISPGLARLVLPELGGEAAVEDGDTGFDGAVVRRFDEELVAAAAPASPAPGGLL